MNTPGGFRLQGLNTTNMRPGAVYAISPLDLQIDAQRPPKHGRDSQSPSMSPVESKGSPQGLPRADDSFSHWNFNPFVASRQGECLACGYRYTTVEELADHQRVDHGLAEVIF